MTSVLERLHHPSSQDESQYVALASASLGHGVATGMACYGASADQTVVFDSDVDTGDSIGWDCGFFQVGTALWHPMRPPTHPEQAFAVYISRESSRYRPLHQQRTFRVPLHVAVLGEDFAAFHRPVVDIDLPTQLQAAPALDVAARLGQMKADIGLPVLDLAQMIGLKRRRFYDLLDGQEPDSERVGVIFAVTDLTARIAELLDNRKKAASALLAPVVDGESFFDIASRTGEVEVIRDAGATLLNRLGADVQVGSRPRRRLLPARHLGVRAPGSTTR